MRRLIRPITIQGKIRLFSLMFYLATANVVFTQNKPPTAVSRTLQTQNFAADTKKTLKASINALQDLDYTIDVLNSDVGLITASRTTEQKKAEVSSDGVDPGPSSQNNKFDEEIDAEEAAKKEQAQTCVKIFGVAVVAVFFVVLLSAIFGDKDDDDDDDDDDRPSSSSSSSGWRRSSRSSHSSNKTVNNYYQDNSPKGPRIYRYKVTINIDESGPDNTNVRVSASGELEGNSAYGEYKFSFRNVVNQMEDIPFGWVRVSSAMTVKKNIADFSIPLLAKTALSVGVGVNSHSSTPRASVSMVRDLLDTDDLTAGFDPNSLEDELIDYLKENKIDNSGTHLQLGLRFKILVIDSHLNFRYNMTEDVYKGEKGFTEVQFKLGMAF